MVNPSTALAFVCGCLTAATVHLVTDAHAASRGPGAAAYGRSATESRLEALERRAHAIALGQMSSQVVAPFQVVNAAGNPIFTVDGDGAYVYGGGRVAARMGGDPSGGRLLAKSPGRSVWLDGSADLSFSVEESGVDPHQHPTSFTRIDLGRTGSGSYRLKFMSKAGLTVAGIGEDRQSHTGAVMVADKQGRARAMIGISNEGNGLINVIGNNLLPIAQLTQGSHGGGLFLICAVSGCPPRMVEMGDAGGFGMVSTGPHWFNPDPTMFGLPGSVLFGRP